MRRCPHCQSTRLIQEIRGRRFRCVACGLYCWPELEEQAARKAEKLYDWIMQA